MNARTTLLPRYGAALVPGASPAMPVPLMLSALALAVTLLFSLAVNVLLASAYGGPAAGARQATFSAVGGRAPYEPAPSMTFARQRPLTVGAVVVDGE